MHIRYTLRTSLVAALAMGSMALASATPSKVVVFGDSLSDTGNVAARFQTVGIALPASPYEDGRFTNGPVAVEVMASTLGVSLESYAYGGALTGVDNRITTGGVLTGTGVQGQITSYVGSQGGAVDASALYVVWAGGNDFFSNASAATVTSAVTNLMTDVSILYQAGARQFFVPNLPNLADTADAIAAGGAQQAGAYALSVGFNNALSQYMGQLQGQLAGSTIQVFDTFSFLSGVRAQYAAAEGGNVTSACYVGNYLGQGTACATPDSYYLWDSVHPTAGVHNAVGVAFAAAVPEPSTYGLMLLGLAGVGLVASRQRREVAQA